MRTRTSPRNQEILWRALGGPAPVKHDATSVESIERQISACTNARTRRQLERDLQSAKIRRAARGT